MPPNVEKINAETKDLFIQIQVPNVPKTSFVWNYFGHLWNSSKESLDLDRVYCKICFDKAKETSPNSAFSAVRTQIGNYRATSGTGNMRNHLLAIHQITEAEVTKKSMNHILSMFARDKRSARSLELKEKLSHQLTLMCCKDLLPFSIVENEG